MKDVMLSLVGKYFFYKYRNRAAKVGYYQAAQQMRKQGIPLHVSRVILLWRH